MQLHNTANWSNHYRQRVGDSYPAFVRQQYQPFLDELRSVLDTLLRVCITNRNIVVREEGCGIGTVTKILAQDYSQSKVDFIAFDYDSAQVENTTANLLPLLKRPSVYQGNHFKNHGLCNIVHAHGVLEHFTDAEIESILKRQCDEAQYVIHYVPLIGHGVGSYGDERLLPIEHWVTTHKPTKYFVFNNGKDAVLVWDNN